MKKAFLIFTVFNILLCSMPAYGQWSDSELRTLEGSYKFTFVVNNPDNAISRLKSSQFYDGSDSLADVPADKNTLRLLAILVALLVFLHLFRKRKKK